MRASRKAGFTYGRGCVLMPIPVDMLKEGVQNAGDSKRLLDDVLGVLAGDLNSGKLLDGQDFVGELHARLTLTQLSVENATTAFAARPVANASRASSSNASTASCTFRASFLNVGPIFFLSNTACHLATLCDSGSRFLTTRGTPVCFACTVKSYALRSTYPTHSFQP